MSKILRGGRALILSAVIGVILGFLGGAFYLCIKKVTEVRQANPVFLLLLPIGAALIALFYKILEKEPDGGTNRVIEAAYTDRPVSIKMAIGIFVSTVFSHLSGASVGREGAALQLGGSVGYNVGRVLHLSDEDRRFCTVAGMSACFSAIFGTPMAAAVFALEIAVVGQMNLLWLVPSLVASYIARIVARTVGAPDLMMSLADGLSFTAVSAGRAVIVAVCCGIVAWIFCTLLHIGERQVGVWFKNPYISAVVLGCIIFVLSLIFKGQTYNGAGVDQIALFMQGKVYPWQFFLKMIFTLLSVYAGYKGGEIVPSFYIGGALGASLGLLLGLDPAIACAVGMVSMFCGVTKCPIAAFVIGLEIFGADGAPFFMIASAVSFICSGKTGLYNTQKYLPSVARES